MPKLPGINHLDAIRAFSKVGFVISRQGKHVIMSNGQRRITIPRGNPINPFTIAGIVRAAGLSIEQFRSLL